MNKIACIIPTYCGRDLLARLLDSLVHQSITFDTYIVDSSSEDGTLELALKHKINVTVIPKIEFDHGKTRQLMVNKFPDYDYYIFLTQDAYLNDSKSIESILAPFKDPSVGAAYGRQLPHLDANLLAQHARLFNYGINSEIRSISDIPRLGLKTAFMSNSFAAYRSKTLRKINGFPSDIIFAEDMFVAAKILIGGMKIAYVAEATCRHSHNYSPINEFKRYFDMGVFHAKEPWLMDSFGGVSNDGLKYCISEINFLGLNRIYLWPRSIIGNALKLIGYKLGLNEKFMPNSLKKRLSMNSKYWSNEILTSPPRPPLI